MDRLPKVSVVIPTFNQPNLLLETLETVFAQTFTDFEIVIINDGSTDETLAVLGTLSDPRVRIISQPNGGIGVARNRGIDEAVGTYIALLDHDDLWMPAKLATQVAFMESHPDCVCVTVPWAQSMRPTQPEFEKAAAVDAGGIVQRPLDKLARGFALMTSSALMFDREKAKGLRYATARGAIEDFPFQIGLLARGEFGVAGDEILMVYRRHASNYSGQCSFFYKGLKQLRALDEQGLFSAFTGQARKDLNRYLAWIGRLAVFMQLRGGFKQAAAKLYLVEMKHQLRQRRWRFTLAVPLLLTAPNTIMKRRFPDIHAR